MDYDDWLWLIDIELLMGVCFRCKIDVLGWLLEEMLFDGYVMCYDYVDGLVNLCGLLSVVMCFDGFVLWM